MNRRRNWLCVVFAAVLLLSGCAAGKPDQQAHAPAVSLTALQYEIENVAVDFSNMWFYRQIEAQTGVHVDFDEVKDSEWDSSVSLAFAKGKLPDLILRGSLDVEEYGVSRHLLVPLDEYIRRGLMPNYAARLENSGLRDQLTASDGHMYQLGFLISQDVNTNGHFFINRNWLEKLGLDEPQTVEQLADVLRRFRDDDPNGNGLQDSGEPGLENVTVILIRVAADYSESECRRTVTDAAGRYRFDFVRPGTYRVQFELPAGYAPTVFLADYPTINSKLETSTKRPGLTATFQVRSGETYLAADAGVVEE